MDEKRARRLAAHCAQCCANRDALRCGQCRMYKCKMVRRSSLVVKGKSSSHASAPQSVQAASQSASPHGSAKSAEQSGASSAHVSAASKSDARYSSAPKSSSKKSTVLPSTAAAQSDPIKSSSKKSSVLDVVAAETHAASSSEKPVPSAPKDSSGVLDEFEPTEGEPERTACIVVDGWDVAKYHDRKGFRSVNVVRALKYLYKHGMKPVAFVPSSYVDIGSKTSKLADDPCVLKHIKDRGFLQFTENKQLYAWEMLTYAKNNGCSILSNRRFEHKRKVKIPNDVEMSPEELDELYEYVKDRRMTYTFKKVFDIKV